MSHSPTTSRTLGALLGVHAGDSLGATLEFSTWSSILSSHPTGLREIVGGGPFHWAPGAATDDTDLTRAVLLAYRDKHQHSSSNSNSTSTGKDADFDVAKAAADHALTWLEGVWPGRTPGSGPADIGNATQQGLALYKRTQDPSRAGAGIGSAGNGSLMRCIPTGLFAADEQARKQESVAISEVTHNDPRCTVACAAYNEIVAQLVAGVDAREAVEAGKHVAGGMRGGKQVVSAIEEGEKIELETVAREGPDAHGVSTSGYVLSSLKLGVAAVLDARGLEDVLVDVVRLGGDTDTHGAIAGGLLGARDGVESIPERWLSKLQFRREFEEVAMGILEAQRGRG